MPYNGGMKRAFVFLVFCLTAPASAQEAYKPWHYTVEDEYAYHGDAAALPEEKPAPEKSWLETYLDERSDKIRNYQRPLYKPPPDFESQMATRRETPDTSMDFTGGDNRYSGRTISLHRTKDGGLGGDIGGESFNLQARRDGSYSGTLGGRDVSLSRNRIGTITGHIGHETVDLQENHLGGLQGRIGAQQVQCYPNSLGQLVC